MLAFYTVLKALKEALITLSEFLHNLEVLYWGYVSKSTFNS